MDVLSMGMSLSLVSIGDSNIDRLLHDPPLVWKVIAPEEPRLYESARAATVKRSVLSRLMGRAAPVEAVPDLEMADDEGIATDLDKAWHGIHYLLTGDGSEGAFPAGFLVSGGTDVGDVDVGYGPARTLTSAQTREALAFLDRVSDDELRRRFKPADMMAAEIYPEIWDRDPAQDDTLGYVMEYVRVLRGFLRQTVDAGRGIILYLS
jgi:hypothetical protein